MKTNQTQQPHAQHMQNQRGA